MTAVNAHREKLGVNDQVSNAQIIAQNFADSLEDGQCLVRIPISLLIQAEQYEYQLRNILDGLKADQSDIPEPDHSFTYKVPVVDDGIIQQGPKSPKVEIASSLKSKLLADCIPCGLEAPDFDLSGFFDGMLSEIEAFVSFLTDFLSDLKPKYCHFAYLLSFVCIPDLVKILSVILARIIQLTSTISLGNFSIGMFISAIIGTLFETILDFIMNMLQFGVTPVSCLITSLQEIINNVPTRETLQRRLSEDQYRLLYNEERPSTLDTLYSTGDIYSDKLDSQYSGTINKIRNEFNKAKFTVQDAADGIIQQLDELIGLKNHMSCDFERNTGIKEAATALVDLIQMANLIRSVIGKKINRFALDELCKYEPDSNLDTTNPLDLEEIAEILEDNIDFTVEIIENEDGEGLGFFIGNPKPEPSPERLSIYDCSLADFIRNSSLDNLLIEAVDIAETELKGPAKYTPRAAVGNIRRRRISLNEINLDPINPSPNVVLFDLRPDNNDIIRFINQLYGFNPLVNQPFPNFFDIRSATIDRPITKVIFNREITPYLKLYGDFTIPDSLASDLLTPQRVVNESELLQATDSVVVINGEKRIVGGTGNLGTSIRLPRENNNSSSNAPAQDILNIKPKQERLVEEGVIKETSSIGIAQRKLLEQRTISKTTQIKCGNIDAIKNNLNLLADL